MIVDCALYEAGRRVEGNHEFEEAVARAGDRDGSFVWVGLFEPTMDELDDLAREFDLHPLAVEDAVHAHQRPKLETYGDQLFAVLKTATYVDHDEVIELGELMLFLGEHHVITVRHGPGLMGSVRDEMEADPDRLALGTGAVLHALLDRVVDDYERVLVDLDVDIDQIESEVFSGDGRDHAQRIFKLKREVVDFRRAVRPLVPAVAGLATGKVHNVDPSLSDWFRDVHDHLLRVSDHLDVVDALLDGALQADLAQVGVRQNEDMRKISAWVAIAAVPTMIAGIYGMNFDHMPELGTRYGYYVILVVMVLACFGLYRTFKRRGWL